MVRKLSWINDFPFARMAAMNNAWTVLVQGFSTTAVLIMAIGAQNAFVLRQGLRREHIGAVVAICVLSDVVLIHAGVWGLGTAAAAHPSVALGARLFGALYLAWYAVCALRRALQPQGLHVSTGVAGSTLTHAVGTTLALTWLNPHVYLDTVLLIGSMASPFDGMERAAFAAGASLASLVWFFCLGWGARWLTPWFASPAAWRRLDLGIALLMAALAVQLVQPVFQRFAPVSG